MFLEHLRTAPYLTPLKFANMHLVLWRLWPASLPRFQPSCLLSTEVYFFSFICYLPAISYYYYLLFAWGGLILTVHCNQFEIETPTIFSVLSTIFLFFWCKPSQPWHTEASFRGKKLWHLRRYSGFKFSHGPANIYELVLLALHECELTYLQYP